VQQSLIRLDCLEKKERQPISELGSEYSAKTRRVEKLLPVRYINPKQRRNQLLTAIQRRKEVMRCHAQAPCQQKIGLVRARSPNRRSSAEKTMRALTSGLNTPHSFLNHRCQLGCLDLSIPPWCNNRSMALARATIKHRCLHSLLIQS